MKLTRGILCFCSLCLLFIGCAKDIVDYTASISGYVKDSATGELLSNCTVTLSVTGQTCITGNDGSFSFDDVEPGTYELTYTKMGYENQSKKVTVWASQHLDASVLLKAKSPFGISETELDFGDYNNTLTFSLYNNSDNDTKFVISGVPSWVHLSDMSGTVPAESSVAVTAQVDRSVVGYGSYSEVAKVSYTGNKQGSVALTFKMQKVNPSKPIVSISKTISNLSQTSFKVGGSLEATGGSQVKSYGHCWSLSQNPTISSSKTDKGASSEATDFVSELTGLTAGKTYYVRAYATNANGTAYSEEIAVTTKKTEESKPDDTNTDGGKDDVNPVIDPPDVTPTSTKWDGTKATAFKKGSGTLADPYQITTGGELLLIGSYSSKYFVLKNDIDLDNRNWMPVKFSGNFDGGGHTISNLYVSRTNEKQGLFSEIAVSSLVKNLTIKGVKIEAPEYNYVGALVGDCEGEVSNVNLIFLNNSVISGKNYVGGIAGYNYGIAIHDCKVSSSSTNYQIKGNFNVGGITGRGGAIVNNCHVNANIIGGESVGGVIGVGSVKASSFNGNIQGEKRIGGIVGSASYPGNASANGIIEACKVVANISGTQGVGGIVGYGGYYNSVNVIACYSDGTVTSSGPYVGGIVGESSQLPKIYLSYSTMTSTSSNFYGFAGIHNYSGSNQYANAYDSATTASQANFKGNGMNNSVANCTNITSHLQSAYSDYANLWNFNKTWIWTGKVNGQTCKVSCPRLAWEK